MSDRVQGHVWRVRWTSPDQHTEFRDFDWKHHAETFLQFIARQPKVRDVELVLVPAPHGHIIA